MAFLSGLAWAGGAVVLLFGLGGLLGGAWFYVSGALSLDYSNMGLAALMFVSGLVLTPFGWWVCTRPDKPKDAGPPSPPPAPAGVA